MHKLDEKALAADAREALFLNYAEAVKRNARELATMPLSVIIDHHRDFADELSALAAAPSPAPVAVKALQLHVAYEAVPADRGGKNGPKGRAWAAFIEARDEAIRSALVPADEAGGQT